MLFIYNYVVYIIYVSCTASIISVKMLYVYDVYVVTCIYYILKYILFLEVKSHQYCDR